MPPTQEQIEVAAFRLAHMSRFPTFAGGLYAFASDGLDAGAWMAAEDPCLQLAPVAVTVPASLRAEPFRLAEARCRILIEDAAA
jgi:hypothetical protein